MSFSLSVQGLIKRWQQDGLIDGDTAAILTADLAKRSAFSLGTVLATLGGLLLGAAVILLVASNWQEMPRLMRICLIFVLIWGCYLGGAWRQSRGDTQFPAALYVVGAAAFGAGIALVGQMYHLSGDLHTAAIYWSVGVLVAALLLRAPVLAAFGAAVACFYLSTNLVEGFFNGEELAYLWVGPLLLLLGIAATLFTRSRLAAHLWALFFISWILLLHFQHHQSLLILGLMLLFGIGLMLMDGFAHARLQKLTRFAHPLATYGLLMAVLSLLTLNVMVEVGQSLFYSITTLGLAIGAIALCGRDNGGLRILAYIVFSLEILYLALQTIGTIIDTAGLFLVAGILVLLLALFVRRMEKRYGNKRRMEVQA